MYQTVHGCIFIALMFQASHKQWEVAREVNNNNALGGQLIFFAQKSKKIINWVGSFQF